MSSATAVAAAAAAASSGDGASSSSSAYKSTQTPFWEYDTRRVESWARSKQLLISTCPARKTLWQNLIATLRTVAVTKHPGAPVSAENGKKRKRATYTLADPHHVWIHASPLDQRAEDNAADDNRIPWNAEDTIPPSLGGRLAQISLGGLVNALAGPRPRGSPILMDQASPLASKVAKLNATTLIITGSDITALTLYETIALPLHRAVAVRVHADILTTTPIRIQHMLAPDLDASEFAGVRRRIYETVILGRGIHTNDGDAVDGNSHLATGKPTLLSDAEKFKKCPTCQNNDQSSFVTDRKNGDLICQECGTVVSESLVHEGQQFRKFEGEVDRNHHGDAANPLYSNAHNMSTTLGGVSQVTGAGRGGFGSAGGGGGKQNLETILRNAHAYTELNVSQFGKTDRRTRIGYKDRQKKDAFISMTHVGDALSLHEAVVQRAKEIFAGFRDDRELVQQFKAVIAACLCEAFEQLSTQGQKILKQQEVEAATSTANVNDAAAAKLKLSKRAARRNELHHATLAGKGGLQLDFSNVETDQEAALSAVASKPAATWDLEECRTWLLEAAQNIAKEWVADRDERNNKKIPAGTKDQLEGQLVEHTFTLCEFLQQELLQRNKQGSRGAGRRVVTPRITDMSKLGIKWQHKHERGSGGKGGVGGSGKQGVVPNGRTAGQVLILLSAKKFGSILKDALVGDAVHKELRNAVGKQETRKIQQRRKEESRQRLNQMKRKPWLQARVEQATKEQSIPPPKHGSSR